MCGVSLRLILLLDHSLNLLAQALKSNQILTFAFLSTSHVLLGVLPSGRHADLDAFNPDDAYHKPSLEVLWFPNGVDERGVSSYICMLDYPNLVPGVFPYHFSIRSDPAPGWTPATSQKVPFYVAPGERVLVLKVSVLTSSRVLAITHFIPLSTIMDCMNSAPRIVDEDTPTIPWEAWGPAGSRMTADIHTDNSWVCHVFGSRFCNAKRLRMRPSDGNAWVTRFKVWDFNQRAVRFGRAQNPTGDIESAPEDKYRYVVGPSEFEVEDIFTERVVTKLPYRFKTILAPKEIADRRQHVAVMLSEDSIIFIDVSACAHIHGVALTNALD